MTNATQFSVDDITLAYSQEDYEAKRPEPKLNTYFEFRVAGAVVEQAPKGHLQVKLTLEALNSNGKMMFRKYNSLPVPVSFGDNIAPEWSKGLWLQGARPFFPDDAAYDRTEKDAVTNRLVYYKGDTQLKAGAEFDAARTEANRKCGERAKKVAVAWMQDGDGTSVEDFVGKHVFAEIVLSKNGQYRNLGTMQSEPPRETEVVYEAKDAFER